MRRSSWRADGVDVERAVRAQARALRLPARRRHADRPDDPRRPHLDLRRAPHGRAGLVRLPRARHLARGSGHAGRCARTSARSRRSTRALFESELVPVGEFAVDEGPRRDTSLEKLAALEAGVRPEGTTTAGNAPGVNDGAGALVVTSEEFARKRRGLEVLATILSQGYVADEFAYLARTPAKAGGDRAREGREVDRRRRAGRAQRGVLARWRSTRRRCWAPTRSG